MAIPVGTVLKGQYRIDALIGGGGMALVYRVYDTNLQRVCAIKQNMDTSPEAQRQFHLEAILLAGLNHPHLARVTDHFVDSVGQQYLVMDFVEGENLESYVARNGPVTEVKALAWMAGVLDAVAYCHSQGVIHRDIKPANLVKRNGRDTVVLVDFGIAKQQLSGMTLVGARAATPAYAPLEQFTGHTDARSDVYALGATLYYLLTGQEPPDARLVASGMENITPLQALNARISPSTEQAVCEAMALRVGDRPQNVAGLQTALAGQQLPSPKPIAHSRRTSRWRALRVAFVAIAVLAMLAASVFAFSRIANSLSSVTPMGTATIEVIAFQPSLESVSPSSTSTSQAAGPYETVRTDTATSVGSVQTPKTVSIPVTAAARPPTSTPAVTDTPTSPSTRPPVAPPPTKPPPTSVSSLAPTLQNPPDGAEQRNDVILQWSHGGLQLGQQYRVDMRTEHNQPDQALRLTTTGASLLVRFNQYGEFFKDDGATYFWTVVVINDSGNVASSRPAEWKFVFRQDVPSAAATDTPVPPQATHTPPEPSTPEPTPTPRG